MSHTALLLNLLLLNLLVIGDDLADAIDKAALVVWDQPHKDLLLGGVQEHEDPHLTRCGVGEVHAARLPMRKTEGVRQCTSEIGHNPT